MKTPSLSRCEGSILSARANELEASCIRVSELTIGVSDWKDGSRTLELLPVVSACPRRLWVDAFVDMTVRGAAEFWPGFGRR